MPQLLSPIGVANVTLAPQAFDGLSTTIGGCVVKVQVLLIVFTVISNEHDAELFDGSVAVQVT